MAGNQKALKKDKSGVLAPQHFDDKINDYDYVRGTDGATHVKVNNTVSVTPFTSKDLVVTTLVYAGPSNVLDGQTTTANSINTSPTINLLGSEQVTVNVKSKNQGTLVINYSIDGLKTDNVSVTSSLVDGNYVFDYKFEFQIVTAKLVYTETSATGNIFGVVQTKERVVL